ncbi:Flp family type IVb pilin [Flexivirga sp.]|uniref:Flp family type IVb pilin n=1 Tax=Flexivirga sp. TaxID=1962927 RepID=UPI003F7E9EE3
MMEILGVLREHLSRQRVSRNESGATMAEYAFLIALIALVAFSAVQFFGTAVRGLFTGFPSAF